MSDLTVERWERRISGVLAARIVDEIVIALHGPRSVGKSTVLREFADVRGATIIDLDDLRIREAAARNPELVTAGPIPLCIDEYQRVPDILDAIKARLNASGSAPGTAVLTGSTRHDALPRTAQALTGRLHVLDVLPLSQGELAGTVENFVSSLFEDPVGVVGAHPTSTTTRHGYAERIVTGGMPLAVQRSLVARNRWMDDYVRQSIERDIADLARIRDRRLLMTIFERCAAQTAQPLNILAIGRDLSAKNTTVDSYVRLLEDLYLLYRLPAWGTTIRARARRHPKIHLVDSGIAARVMRLTGERLSRLDPAALTEFGHLLETFVVGEVRKQASWMDDAITLGHWRTDGSEEVDLVLEHPDGRVVGIEIKADERVPESDLRGLRVLREALGDRFIAGVALTTGSRSFTFEERIHICPIDRLWRRV
jgi:predicted AAA+ superfamily ATPase